MATILCLRGPLGEEEEEGTVQETSEQRAEGVLTARNAAPRSQAAGVTPVKTPRPSVPLLSLFHYY